MFNACATPTQAVALAAARSVSFWNRLHEMGLASPQSARSPFSSVAALLQSKDDPVARVPRMGTLLCCEYLMHESGTGMCVVVVVVLVVVVVMVVVVVVMIVVVCAVQSIT